jgi:hypothetical protein
VSVPVLSKQQISTLPANGILKEKKYGNIISQQSIIFAPVLYGNYSVGVSAADP